MVVGGNAYLVTAGWNILKICFAQVVRRQRVFFCQDRFILQLDLGAGKALNQLVVLIQGSGIDISHFEQEIARTALGHRHIQAEVGGLIIGAGHVQEKIILAFGHILGGRKRYADLTALADGQAALVGRCIQIDPIRGRIVVLIDQR